MRDRVVIDIRCAPQAAFTYVAEQYFATVGAWDASVRDLTKLSEGQIGVGTRGRERRPLLGISEFSITEYEPGRRLTLRSEPGPILWERSFVFGVEQRHARIVYNLTLEPGSGWAKLAMPAISKASGRAMQRAGRHLRLALETDRNPSQVSRR